MAEKTPDKVENADKTEKTPAESPPKENPLTKEQMGSLQTIITDTICLMCRGVSAKYETMKIESLTVVTVDEQMVKVHFTKHMSADGKEIKEKPDPPKPAARAPPQRAPPVRIKQERFNPEYSTPSPGYGPRMQHQRPQYPQQWQGYPHHPQQQHPRMPLDPRMRAMATPQVRVPGPNIVPHPQYASQRMTLPKGGNRQANPRKAQTRRQSQQQLMTRAQGSRVPSAALGAPPKNETSAMNEVGSPFDPTSVVVKQEPGLQIPTTDGLQSSTMIVPDSDKIETSKDTSMTVPTVGIVDNGASDESQIQAPATVEQQIIAPSVDESHTIIVQPSDESQGKVPGLDESQMGVPAQSESLISRAPTADESLIVNITEMPPQVSRIVPTGNIDLQEAPEPSHSPEIDDAEEDILQEVSEEDAAAILMKMDQESAELSSKLAGVKSEAQNMLLNVIQPSVGSPQASTGERLESPQSPNDRLGSPQATAERFGPDQGEVAGPFSIHQPSIGNGPSIAEPREDIAPANEPTLNQAVLKASTTEMDDMLDMPTAVNGNGGIPIGNPILQEHPTVSEYEPGVFDLNQLPVSGETNGQAPDSTQNASHHPESTSPIEKTEGDPDQSFHSSSPSVDSRNNGTTLAKQEDVEEVSASSQPAKGTSDQVPSVFKKPIDPFPTPPAPKRRGRRRKEPSSSSESVSPVPAKKPRGRGKKIVTAGRGKESEFTDDWSEENVMAPRVKPASEPRRSSRRNRPKVNFADFEKSSSESEFEDPGQFSHPQQEEDDEDVMVTGFSGAHIDPSPVSFGIQPSTSRVGIKQEGVKKEEPADR